MKKIEKIINNEIKYMLSEVDIDAEVQKIVGKKRIRKLIEETIYDDIRTEVSDAIEKSIFKAIQKQQPLIDAGVASRVTGFLIQFDELTKQK